MYSFSLQNSLREILWFEFQNSLMWYILPMKDTLVVFFSYPRGHKPLGEKIKYFMWINFSVALYFTKGVKTVTLAWVMLSAHVMIRPASRSSGSSETNLLKLWPPSPLFLEVAHQLPDICTWREAPPQGPYDLCLIRLGDVWGWCFNK